MNTTQLETFLKIIETKNFTAAANLLGYAQSTVTTPPPRPQKRPISWTNPTFPSTHPQNRPISWTNPTFSPTCPQNRPFPWTNSLSISPCRCLHPQNRPNLRMTRWRAGAKIVYFAPGRSGPATSVAASSSHSSKAALRS